MARRQRRASGPHAPERAPARERGGWWRIAVLACAVVATYANSLTIPFVLDDQGTVVQNPAVQDLSSLRAVLLPPENSSIAGRPLASLSFALNYAAGGLDVRGYHAVNIALHITCAVLILLGVRRTLALPRFASSAAVPPANLSLAAALLWAVHPLNSEVINYLSQRTEALMAVCYLLTMYASMRAAGAGAAGRWRAMAIGACAAGMLSKESMATAPLMVVLYDRVFLYPSLPAAVAARKRLYAGLAATWLILVAVVATGPRAAVAGFSAGVSPWTYLLNQAVMITEYLRLALWPDTLVVLYGWPLSLTLSDVVPQFVFVASLFAATIVALWRWPAVGFAGAWFFLTLAPASSIIPVATEVGAERRMYLPLIALAVLVVAALAAVARKLAPADSTAGVRSVRVAEAAVLGVAAMTAAGLAMTTVARNREYRSPLQLAQTVVERRPTALAHHFLAERLLDARRDEEAVGHLRQAVALGNSRAAYVLGRLLIEQGKHAEGREQLEAFLGTSERPDRLVPRWLEPPVTEVVPARFTLARSLALEGQWDRAVMEAEKVLKVVPSHVGAHGLLGDAAFARQDWSAAARHYRTYLARQPADVGALISYGITQVATNDLDEAIDSFERATRIDPANARAHQLLAMAQQDRADLAGRR